MTSPDPIEPELAPTGQGPVYELPLRLGDFELREALGQGGMGRVYIGRQLSLDRPVAVKLIAPERAADPAAIARFRREARAAAQVSDPHVIAVIAVDVHEGIHYLVQELVPGGRHLGHRIQEWREGAEEVEARSRRMARILRDAAGALQKVHAAGVLHRDLKPSNLLLAPGDSVRVADFGLAFLQGAVSLTATGHQPGTPLYMSPEQLTGERRALGPASDVFSLGACLYEGLSLSPEFSGGSMPSIAVRILAGNLEDPRLEQPGLDPRLVAICLKALEAEPRRRYGSMGEFAADLDSFLEGRPIAARLPGPVRRARAWVRKRRRLRLAALGAALLAAVAGGVALARSSGPPGAPAEASAEEVLFEGSVADQRRALRSIGQGMGESAAAHWAGVSLLTRWLRESLARQASDPAYAEPPDRIRAGSWVDANPGLASERLAASSPAAYEALRILQERDLNMERGERLDGRSKEEWKKAQNAEHTVQAARDKCLRELENALAPGAASYEYKPHYFAYTQRTEPIASGIASRPWFDLSETRLVGLDRQGATVDLSGARLVGCDLSFSKLTGARLDGTDLSGSWILGAELPGALMRQASLEGCTASGVDFGGAKMQGSILSTAHFRRCNFWGTQLQGAYLMKARFERILHMSGACLDDAMAWAAVFDGSHIGHESEDQAGASFRRAYLRGASFRNVYAVRSDFRDADLRGADFSAADLGGSRFEGADLRGADFTTARGLAPSWFAGAVTDATTRMPVE